MALALRCIFCWVVAHRLLVVHIEPTLEAAYRAQQIDSFLGVMCKLLYDFGFLCISSKGHRTWSFKGKGNGFADYRRYKDWKFEQTRKTNYFALPYSFSA
jgi:hypothetical protein